MYTIKNDLEELLKRRPNSIGNISASKKISSAYYDIRNKILLETSHMPIKYTISNRIYCILNDIIDVPLCKCGCKTPLNNPSKLFYKAHGNRDKDVKLKKEEKYLKNYGVKNPSQSEEIKNKKEQTFKDKFGGTCPFNSPIIVDRIKENNIKKYGVENVYASKEIQDKIKATNIERYGVEYALQNKDIKNKQENTNIERYGVSAPLQNDEIKEKWKHTNMIKYGVDYGLSNDEVKKKGIETSIEKYGTRYASQSDEIKKIIYKKRLFNIYQNFSKYLYMVEPLFSVEEFKGTSYDIFYNWLCKKCNKEFKHYYYSYMPRCPICYPKHISIYQKEIYDFIVLLGYNVEMNIRKIISPLELDIYVPEKQIAIEFNGLYWHGENNGTLPNYHVKKTSLCEENGIKLIHIFEDEWIYKNKIVKSRLCSIFNKIKYRIYGRECIIKNIDNMLKNKFLNKYHIQGEDKSSIRLGAFYKNRLVAVMTFGKPRFSMNNEYELIRFVTISNFNIIGIAGKLLSFFEKNYKPKNIITYADKRWSNGNLYYKLGFEYKHTSASSYYYFKDTIRFNRTMFMKHLLQEKLKIFDNNLTEWENMKNNGYDRIWDCGNLVFVKNF